MRTLVELERMVRHSFAPHLAVNSPDRTASVDAQRLLRVRKPFLIVDPRQDDLDVPVAYRSGRDLGGGAAVFPNSQEVMCPWVITERLAYVAYGSC